MNFGILLGVPRNIVLDRSGHLSIVSIVCRQKLSSGLFVYSLLDIHLISNTFKKKLKTFYYTNCYP